MCVTSGGGVKLSAYGGIHIVICGFRAFACAFCTAFNNSLILNFLLSAESSLQRTSSAPSVYLCCPPAVGELADEISRFLFSLSPNKNKKPKVLENKDLRHCLWRAKRDLNPRPSA